MDHGQFSGICMANLNLISGTWPLTLVCSGRAEETPFLPIQSTIVLEGLDPKQVANFVLSRFGNDEQDCKDEWPSHKSRKNYNSVDI